MLTIFADNILPILLVAGVGFLAVRFLKADVQTLSSVTFYALTPCLVFNTLVTSQISAAEFGRMVSFAVSMIAATGLVAGLVSLALRLDRATTSAFLMVAMFTNAGNYGLPLVLFAFGQEALALATVYFVSNFILMYTVGVLLAASGQHGTWKALVNVLKLPTVYVVAAAVVVMLARVTVPAPIMRPIALLGNAALPMMIVVLGMQLGQASLPERPWLVGVATVFRLVVLPALALVLASVLGLRGVEQQAAVVQAAMPTAVIVAVLALEYGAAPSFVTAVVFLSTVLSPLTLTPLIALLK